MKKKIFYNNDFEELEEYIEESYSYYSFLDSKNLNNLTNQLNDLYPNIKVSGKLLEEIKKLCFSYGYIEGLNFSRKKTP